MPRTTIKNTVLSCLIVLAGSAAAQTLDSPRLTTQQLTILRLAKPQRITTARDLLLAQRTTYQLTADYDFQPRTTLIDHRGRFHIRFAQRFKGVRILNSGAIVHLTSDGQVAGNNTTELYRDLNLNVTPTLDARAIETRTQQLFCPRAGCQAFKSTSELVIFPTARRTVELAYRIAATAANVEPRFYVLSAHTGAMLDQWEGHVESDYDAVAATGKTLHYGDVPFTAARKKQLDNPFDTWHRLLDPTRGNSVVMNMNQQLASDNWSGQMYSGMDTVWGNNQDFTYSDSTWSPTGETVAAEAMWGIRHVWDLLKFQFNRDSLNDDGMTLIARVHARKGDASVPYGDAYWNGAAAHFGDGSDDAATAKTGLKVIGHEFGHGLWSHLTEADTNSGETGGLNEGHADIMGSLVDFYGRGTGGANLPDWPKPEWTWAWVSRSRDPSSYSRTLDDGSVVLGKSYYEAGMGSLPVHVQGCAYGHAFIFLAIGSSTDPASPLHSIYFPNGMPGIGIRKAADIWYLATGSYLVGNATFAKMRAAYIEAAVDLYGAGSDEVKAVYNAFAAINVGTKATDTENPNVSLGNPIVDENEGAVWLPVGATDNMGVAKIELSLANQVQRTGTFAKAGPVYYSRYLSLAGRAPGQYSVAAKATDYVSRTNTETKQIVLTGRNHLIQNGGFESGAASWTHNIPAVFANSEATAFLGSRHAQFHQGSFISQQVAIPATANSAMLAFRLRVDQALGPAQAGEHLLVQVLTPGGSLLSTLATYTPFEQTPSEQTNWYEKKSFSLASYAGQTVVIRFMTPISVPTRFKIDNVNLTWTGPVTGNLALTVDNGERTLTMSLSALAGISNASIKKVEFVIDGVPRIADSALPFYNVISTVGYSFNTSHSVVARIYNFADQMVKEIGPKNFTLTNTAQLVVNGGFESGVSPWVQTGGVVFGQNNHEAQYFRSFLGDRFALMGGKGTDHDETIQQVISLPGNATSAKLTFRLRIDTTEAGSADKLRVQILNHATGAVLATPMQIYSSTDTHSGDSWNGYNKFEVNLTPYIGNTIRIFFTADENAGWPTSFFLDQVSVTASTIGLAGN